MHKELYQNKQKLFILLGFIALCIIHCILAFVSLYNNDDVIYSKLANEIAKNGSINSTVNEHYSLRLTVVYVTAFFYKIFGVNIFSGLLLSLLSTIFSGILLASLVKKYDIKLYFFSLLIFFFAHSTLYYMHRILPDSTICFSVLLMFYAYLNSIEKNKNIVYCGILFSLGFFLAILTKESIIISLPLFVYFLCRDVLRKINLKFWITSAIVSSILIFLYLLYYKLTTGLFFYRYQVLQQSNILTACSFDKMPLSYTIERITYKLWRNFLLNGDMLVFIPAFVAFIYRKKISSQYKINTIHFYSFFVILMLSNFMSISFTAYVPLCQDARHFLFLFPFASIIMTPLLIEYSKKPEKYIVLPILLLISTILIFLFGNGNTKYLYLLFAIISIVPFVLKYHPFFLLGITFLFIIQYIQDIVKTPFPYYFEHTKILQRKLIEPKKTGTLFTADGFTRDVSNFILQYDTSKIFVQNYNDKQLKISDSTYLLLVNPLNASIQYKIDSIYKTQQYQTKINLIQHIKNVSLYKIDTSIISLLKN